MSSACNSTTDTCEGSTDDTVEVWRTLMAVYQGAILFLSLIFNGTVCLLFYRKSHLLSVSNCFVLNLICCQLCMSLLVLPFSLFAAVSQDWQYNGHWCAAQAFLFTVVIVAQQLALLTISIDRNYAIMNSLRYPNVFTPTLCAALIGFSWLFSVVISIPPLLHSGMGEYSFHSSQFVCGLDWSKDKPFLILFTSVIFALPILIECFCYIKIFFAAVGHSKRSSKVRPIGSRPSRIVSVTAISSSDYRSEASTNSSDTEDDGKRNSIECKAVRTIFLIAAVYLVCWVPYFIDCFITIQDDILNPNFSAAAICFLFSSSILNPMIYAYMNRVTRREIARFVCGSSGIGDGDEAFSTSMSTYSPAWVQNRIRSKSNGGLNTDTMDTIVEETEIVDSIFCEPRSGSRLHVARCDTCTSLRLPITSGLKHCEHIDMQSDPRGYNRYKDIVDVDLEEETSVSIVPETSKLEHSFRIDLSKDTQTANPGGWGNTTSERITGEMRRPSSKTSESYFSKGKRRRKRDCGSFLYFENNEEGQGQKSNHGSRQKKRRPVRYSVDQVHNISLSQLPSLMKVRLSLNQTDLKSINSVTFKSDIEFENKYLEDDEVRAKSSSPVLESHHVNNDKYDHQSEHRADTTSTSTSTHNNSRPITDMSLENEESVKADNTNHSVNKNCQSSVSTSNSMPNYRRLNSAPGRCQNYIKSESASANTPQELTDKTWDVSLPNGTES